jgi:glycosyltransferase involved in cell wall biosynthesis
MSIIAKRFPEIRLLLIGDNKKPNLVNPILQMIKEYNLKDNVIFTGIVEKRNIPYYLTKAKVLVLSRPDNLQAQGGFPTKLGEYLLSGRPTVVTKVGEIQEYLTDGVTAFLAEAGSAENFARKVIEALENSELSEIVAKKGKELAKEKFGFKEHGIRLSQFICSDLRCVC